VRLRGHLAIGVCADICVPLQFRISANLPARGGVDPKIAAALAGPVERRSSPVRCRLGPGRNGALALDVELRLPALGPREAVTVEFVDPDSWITDTTLRCRGNTLTAQTILFARLGHAAVIDGSTLVFTVIEGGVPSRCEAASDEAEHARAWGV
jgi:hypothetical protein